VKYRLYIDEVGNPDLGASADPNHRFLSLTGVAITSRQLKVKSKANNIAGLQLADLMAHASFRATLARREGRPLPANFGGRIAAILETDKYHRNAAGVIEGWGRKWLP
jgi:hypothetical protein